WKMEIAAPFQKHSPTSREAARAISGKVGPMERELLVLFFHAGDYGWTDDALIEKVGTQSVRPRRIYLTAIGKLRDSGTTRKTRTGRNAVVWLLA
ncbi:MAG: hypothetical protein AABZ67_02755, partial [Pseudomonadota bacterium]